MNLFQEVLGGHELEPASTKIDKLPEDAIIWMANALKDFSSATEQVYITATIGLYEYIAGENLAQINLPRVRLLVKQRTRRQGIRLPPSSQNLILKLSSITWKHYLQNHSKMKQND